MTRLLIAAIATGISVAASAISAQWVVRNLTTAVSRRYDDGYAAGWQDGAAARKPSHLRAVR